MVGWLAWSQCTLRLGPARRSAYFTIPTLSAGICRPPPAETAARDRLGKGHKIEIKPLSSILDKIKQRQALAIARWGAFDGDGWGPKHVLSCKQQQPKLLRVLCMFEPLVPRSHACRAPKPSLPDVGSFEDLLAQARQQGGAAPAATEDQQAGDDAAAAGHSPGGSGREGAAAEAGGQAQQAEGGGAGGEEEGDDLLIMESDEEGGEGVRLVDLPASTRKKQQERMPWITQVGAWGC